MGSRCKHISLCKALAQQRNKIDVDGRKREGTDPVVGSEPAPEVSKDRFFEVAIDFNGSKTQDSSTGNGMTFGFVDEEEDERVRTESTKSSSGMTFNFLGDKSDNSSSDATDEEVSFAGEIRKCSYVCLRGHNKLSAGTRTGYIAKNCKILNNA